MKSLTRIFILFFIVGIVLTIISFTSGLTFEMVEDYLNDDESYSDMMTYTTSLAISEINFDFDDRNIVVERVDSPELLITYYEHEDDTWTISEQNGILSIDQKRESNIRFMFNFKFTSRSLKTVKLYIPDIYELDLNLETHVGDIKIVNTNSSIKVLNIKSNTGDIDVLGGSYDEFTAVLDTGNIILSEMNLATILTSTETGNVRVEDSVLTGQLQITSQTGDIKVYNTIASGYDLDTSTGNIDYRYVQALDLRYDLKVTTGYIKIDGNKQGTRHSTTTGSVLFKAESTTGNIIVTTQ